jgi:hypothetical protein
MRSSGLLSAFKTTQRNPEIYVGNGEWQPVDVS